MVDRRLRRSLWWARLRLRWRRYARTLAATHVLDATFTAGLAVGGIITATSKAADSTKVSIVVLLVVAELVWFFGRLILSEVKKLGERSLNVLPADLPTMIAHHLTGERDTLLARAHELAASQTCDLEKHEMYATLIHLTDTVTVRFAGSASAFILAVSGTDLEDFEREVLAREYLDANRRAAKGLVVVRRLFLLDSNQLHSAKIRAIMLGHKEALSVVSETDPGVKWLAKSDAGNDRSLDFAVFANEALVRQVNRPGGTKGELTVNLGQIEPALEAFERLWDHNRAHTLAEYTVAHE
jgi:hypothetical protein